MPVLDLHAVITRISDRKEYTGQYGKYTKQSFLIKDDTGDIWVTANSAPELNREWLNKEVVISAKKTSKGLVGAKFSKSVWKDGKEHVGITINTGAIFDLDTPVEVIGRQLSEGLEPCVVEEVETLDKKPQHTISQSELEKYRSMSIAYAKDLVTSSKLEIEKIFETADAITEYIKSGTKPVAEEKSAEVVDSDEIPF